jgi:hypothetical protein
LIKMASWGGVRSETGEPVLTNGIVTAVQGGQSGTEGCYRRMSRLLKGRKESAADWIWCAVAGLQAERRVSTDANRLARGMRKEKGKPKVQVGWRSTMGVELGSWEKLRARALEIVLRIQGNVNMMVVPRLEVKHRRRYAQLLQSELVGHEDRSLVINTLLWVLAALDGVQVDGLREHMTHSPLVAQWQHV